MVDNDNLLDTVQDSVNVIAEQEFHQVTNSQLVSLNPTFLTTARLSRSKIQEQQKLLITQVEESSDSEEVDSVDEKSRRLSALLDEDCEKIEQECDTDLEIDVEDLLNEQSSDIEIDDKNSYISACDEEGVVPVSYFLRKITETDFVMRFHGLGPKGAKAICVPLENNASIEKLDLEGNCIQKDGAVSLSKILSENYFITELILAENMIGNEGVSALCGVLTDNHRIVKLDLSGNLLDDDSAECFHTMLLGNVTLKQLYLTHNRLEDRAASLLKEVLAHNETLETLDLSWNMIRTNGAILLAEGIQENIGLKHFSLSMNGLGLAGAESMGKAVKANRSLFTLNISYCRIPYQGAIAIANGLHTNDILHSLYIGSNPLSVDGAYAILSAVDKNDSSLITLLDLSNVLVQEQFTKLHQTILETRELNVVHGGVVKAQQAPQEVKLEDPLDTFRQEPMTKLREYVDKAGLRLIDLFKQFDKDQSMSVSCAEFVIGIQAANIGINKEHMDILLQTLDADGDGNIDYGELIHGDKAHRLKKREVIKKKEELDARKQAETPIDALLQITTQDQSTNT